MGRGLCLDLEWAPEIEGPVLDRVVGGRGRPYFALVEQAVAFAGAHEVTPHQAYGKTYLVKAEGLGHWAPEMAANLFPVELQLTGCCAAPLAAVWIG